jgi:hypothetical protein
LDAYTKEKGFFRIDISFIKAAKTFEYLLLEGNINQKKTGEESALEPFLPRSILNRLYSD